MNLRIVNVLFMAGPVGIVPIALCGTYTSEL